MTIFFTSDCTSVNDFDANSGTIEAITDNGRSVLKLHPASSLTINVPDTALNSETYCFCRLRLEGSVPGNGGNAQRARVQFKGTVGGSTINAAQLSLFGDLPYADHAYQVTVGGGFEAGSMRLEIRNQANSGFMYLDWVQARHETTPIGTYDYATATHQFLTTPRALRLGGITRRAAWNPDWIGSSTVGNGLSQYRDNLNRHGVGAWLDEVGMKGWGIVRVDTLQPYHHYTDSYGRAVELSTYYPGYNITCGPTSLCEYPDGEKNALIPELLSYMATNRIKMMLMANVSTSQGGTDPGNVAAEVKDNIEQCLAAGVEVAGVELGNELYTSKDNPVFPTVASYIARVQAVTAALRPWHSTPIGLSVYGKIEDTRKSGDVADWDAALSAAYLAGDLDVDFISVHPYLHCGDEFCTGSDVMMPRHPWNELQFASDRWKTLFPGLRWSVNEININGTSQERANKSFAMPLFWANLWYWCIENSNRVISLQQHSIMQVLQTNGMGLTVSSNPGVVAQTAQAGFFFIKEYAELAEGSHYCALRNTYGDENLSVHQLFKTKTSVLCLANRGLDPVTVQVEEWAEHEVATATTDNSLQAFNMSIPLTGGTLIRSTVNDGQLTVPPMSVMLAQGPGGSTIEAWFSEQYGTYDYG